MRESSNDGNAPTAWKLELNSEVALRFHRVWTKAIREARNPETGPALLRAGLWFRCHTDKEGFHTAAMPYGASANGRLQAMSLAVIFAARWVKSEGKDEEMKKRFTNELAKVELHGRRSVGRR